MVRRAAIGPYPFYKSIDGNQNCVAVKVVSASPTLDVIPPFVAVILDARNPLPIRAFPLGDGTFALGIRRCPMPPSS